MEWSTGFQWDRHIFKNRNEVDCTPLAAAIAGARGARASFLETVLLGFFGSCPLVRLGVLGRERGGEIHIRCRFVVLFMCHEHNR